MQAHALFQSEVDGGVAELARRQGAARFTPSPLSSRRSSRPPTAADPAALPAEESRQEEGHRAAAADGNGPPATLAQRIVDLGTALAAATTAAQKQAIIARRAELERRLVQLSTYDERAGGEDGGPKAAPWARGLEEPPRMPKDMVRAHQLHPSQRMCTASSEDVVGAGRAASRAWCWCTTRSARLPTLALSPY